jgi:hypothetical protein
MPSLFSILFDYKFGTLVWNPRYVLNSPHAKVKTLNDTSVRYHDAFQIATKIRVCLKSYNIACSLLMAGKRGQEKLARKLGY